MASRDVLEQLAEMQRMLKEIKTPPPSKSKLSLPDGMQKSVGAVVKKLREAEENALQLDFDRFANNDIDRVVKETKRLFQDQHWGTGTLEEAFKRVWRNIRDSEKRKEKGTFEKHVERSKLTKRRRTKLQRRKTALVKTDWSPAHRERVQKALTLEMTSPEVSKEDKWKRIPFDWESSKFARTKFDLDTLHRDSLTPRAKRQLIIAIDGSEMTRTPPPATSESWTISRSYSS